MCVCVCVFDGVGIIIWLLFESGTAALSYITRVVMTGTGMLIEMADAQPHARAHTQEELGFQY